MIDKPDKIIGKTYSLFGNIESTKEFYVFINTILDQLLNKYENESSLLDALYAASRRKSNYSRVILENPVLDNSVSLFASYTSGVKNHLKQQPVLKFWDGIMKLKEWQYHIYMLEFALINRINREKFMNCEVKIALLPHCLRDLSKECKASVNGLDIQCQHCSEFCLINESSKILNNNGIEPYIWMNTDLRSILRNKQSGKKSIGILGIACIPELIRGMCSCLKKRIPVVGLPLDANRCIRWMGSFNTNSINIEMLNLLVSEKD